jgi:hypothetical protein
MRRWLVVGAVLAWAPGAVAGALTSFVVPSAFTDAESPDGGNSLPFISGGDTRCQQIFLDFDVPDGPFTIYGLSFRRDQGIVPATKSMASIDFYLSITQLGSTSLNPSFANNVGFNPTLVRSGPLVLSSLSQGPPGGPNAFEANVWFDTPFQYNGGDILLDVRLHSTEDVSLFFDSFADVTNSDAIGRVCSVGPFGGGGGVGSPTGAADSGGLVTRFLLAPEPGALAAMLASVAALALLRRGRA